MNFEDYLPYGMSLDDVIVIGAALSVLMSVFAVWFSVLERDPSHRKAKELSSLRETMRSQYLTPVRRKKIQKPSTSFMKQVVEKFKLLQSDQTQKYTLKLTKAGQRTPEALYRYLFYKLIAPLAGAGAASFYIYVLDATKFAPLGKAGATIAATIVVAKLPDILLANAIQKRQEIIKKALPDGLDLMVICTEAGLSLDAAFKRVAGEMARAAPELADELELTSLELGYLPERHKALQNLSIRVDLPMMRSLVNTLIQAERFGTPLSQSLRVMSAELRTERLLKAEEKAARLPAIMTVPMIIFILPPLFIVLLGPAVMRTIDALSNM